MLYIMFSTFSVQKVQSEFRFDLQELDNRPFEESQLLFRDLATDISQMVPSIGVTFSSLGFGNYVFFFCWFMVSRIGGFIATVVTVSFCFSFEDIRGYIMNPLLRMPGLKLKWAPFPRFCFLPFLVIFDSSLLTPKGPPIRHPQFSSPHICINVNIAELRWNHSTRSTSKALKEATGHSSKSPRMSMTRNEEEDYLPESVRDMMQEEGSGWSGPLRPGWLSISLLICLESFDLLKDHQVMVSSFDSFFDHYIHFLVRGSASPKPRQEYLFFAKRRRLGLLHMIESHGGEIWFYPKEIGVFGIAFPQVRCVGGDLLWIVRNTVATRNFSTWALWLT